MNAPSALDHQDVVVKRTQRRAHACSAWSRRLPKRTITETWQCMRFQGFHVIGRTNRANSPWRAQNWDSVAAGQALKSGTTPWLASRVERGGVATSSQRLFRSFAESQWQPRRPSSVYRAPESRAGSARPRHLLATLKCGDIRNVLERRRGDTSSGGYKIAERSYALRSSSPRFLEARFTGTRKAELSECSK